MHLPIRGLAIAAVLTSAVLVLPTVSHESKSGFAAQAQGLQKDKMSAAEKNRQQVKDLLIKLPDNPPKPDGKAGVRGSATVQSGRLKTAPCSDPECGGERKAKAGTAAQ